MEFGIWSSYLYPLTPEEMTEAFSLKGWTHIELSTEHAEALLKRGDPVSTGQAFRAFADKHGVSFPQGHLCIEADICERQDETVAALKQWLDLFHAVGVKTCVLHGGGEAMLARGCSLAEVNAARVRALSELCRHIDGRDMYICLENMDNYHKTAAEIRALIQEVGSPNLAICLDTGHLNLCGGSPAEFIAQAGNLLKALHIADNEGKTDQHMMPYGRGRVNWGEFLGALSAMKTPYGGLFNFEIPGESRGPVDIRMMKLDYLREMAVYMINHAHAQEDYPNGED